MNNVATYEDAYTLASNEEISWEKIAPPIEEAQGTDCYLGTAENIRILLQRDRMHRLGGFLTIEFGPKTLFNDGILPKDAETLAERIEELLAEQKE
ncbi:hypothetical protein ACFL1B_02995 [Nanoarchaeota archaeon]